MNNDNDDDDRPTARADDRPTARAEIAYSNTTKLYDEVLVGYQDGALVATLRVSHHLAKNVVVTLPVDDPVGLANYILSQHS